MIGFDIDGVLMDFDLHLVNTVREITGYKLPYPMKEFCREFPGCSKEEFKGLLMEAINTIEMTEPIEGSIDSIEKIYDLINEKITFITARPSIKKYDTIRSIKRHVGNKFDFEVIFTDSSFDKRQAIQTRKHIRFFVEDEVKRIMKLSPYIKTGFLMNYPWNKNVIVPNNIVKVNNLEEVYNYMLKIV